MTTQTSRLPFDLSAAMNHLTAKDEKLAELITATLPFQMDADPLQSPYEALLESIAYQSISGKAAATIFGRVKALSATGRAPTPEEMLKLRESLLRKAGLSGAKVLGRRARRTPYLRPRHRRLDRRNVSDLPPRPPRRPPHPRPRRQKRVVN